MAESLKVTPESLHTAASELRRESARIQNALAGLEQEVARLRNGWDGGARDAYDRAQRDWSATFGDMKALLERIANETDRMADEYVARDRDSAKRFTRR